MMEIISHRGCWKSPAEKNAVSAFERSFALGYGTETDVRDCAGALLISHDPPSGDELTLEGLLALAVPSEALLAVNIKADGLALQVRDRFEAAGHKRWFVFDMSIPDTRAQLAAGNPVYVRMSEHEREPAFLDRAAGVWLDAFVSDEWRVASASEMLARNVSVCLVSPELHRRAHEPFWQSIRGAGLHRRSGLVLCTDMPEQATAFFGNER